MIYKYAYNTINIEYKMEIFDPDAEVLINNSISYQREGGRASLNSSRKFQKASDNYYY